MEAAVLTRVRHSPWWAKLLLGLLLVAIALVLVVALFPWDTLRGPINRYVTKKTGREFAITRHLDVKVGRTTRVLMDGVQFANPDWAQDRWLVRANAAEVDVELLPLLLHRRFVLPQIRLAKPQLGLQVEPDGRKTWALGSDTKDERNVPDIGAFVVDEGQAHYVARAQGADVRAQFAMQPGAGKGQNLPLRFRAEGRWHDEAFAAEGHTGNVIALSRPLEKPFPADVQLTSGGTRLRANGSVQSLASLDGVNVDFDLQGDDLAKLYKLVGVVLPDTPHYAVAGHLAREGDTWHVRGLDGRLGRSDIAGDLSFAKANDKPVLTGKLRSRFLDFEDLAPVIGLKEGPHQPAAEKVAATDKDGKKAQKPKDPNRKVLPDTPLDVGRLRRMDADVQVDAARIVNAKGLPLESMATHVKLRDGVLVLDPLKMGVSSGQVGGTLRINANLKPVRAEAHLDGSGIALNRLVPKIRMLHNSLGELQAELDLTAQGASVRQMLASSNGKLALLMGKGRISNLAIEIAGLDGARTLKFFAEGDQPVTVRCAALAFDVHDGLMASRALLLDTDDTIFNGAARINLATEQLDVFIEPQPKHRSFLSLRSPLEVTGTFGAPHGSIDKGALATRALAAVGLGAVNPLLALLATVETGPGHDADCVGVLKRAQAPRAEARVEQTAPPVAGAGGKTVDDPRRMGGAPAATKK